MSERRANEYDQTGALRWRAHKGWIHGSDYWVSPLCPLSDPVGDEPLTWEAAKVIAEKHNAALAVLGDEVLSLRAALAEARHTADNLAYNLDLVRRQLADVERERTDAYTQISGLRDDLRAVEAREAAARRALAEYGRHQATCRDADYADTLAALVREGHDCECGWLRVPRGPDGETTSDIHDEAARSGIWLREDDHAEP